MTQNVVCSVKTSAAARTPVYFWITGSAASSVVPTGISCPNMVFAALVTASLARRKEQGCQTDQREACPPPSSAQGSIPWFLLFGSSRF